MAVKSDNYTKTGGFDSAAAQDHSLVAAVHIDPNEQEEASIVSVGTVKPKSGGYSMTVENEDGTTTEYLFNNAGDPANAATATANLHLEMAHTTTTPVSSTVASTNTAYNRTTENGVVSYSDYTPGEGDPTTFSITIDDLNAKDQFAIQILRSILDKVSNPSDLSKDQMAYYSEIAYKWAGFMMKESGKSRAVIKDSTPSGSTQTTVVGYLENNTEKLLNNIAAALDKTNASITLGETTGIAERITIPELNTLIADYVAGATAGTKVGLKDLITPISTISATNFTTLLTNLNTAITTLTTTLNTALSTNIGTTRTANIGSSGLGNSANNPIYVSGMSGGSSSIPSRSSISQASSIHDFLVYNDAGTAGYSTVNAVFTALKDSIDARIIDWLGAARDAEGRVLTVNVPQD